jgi:sterol 14-demethylase
VQHVAPLTQVRVTVDTDLCRSHAVCIEEGPDIFEIGDDGKVSLLRDFSQGANETDYEALRLAAKYCPTQAIRVGEL